MFVSCFVRRSQAERSDIVFAIHCGVAASRTNVSIEQFARNGPYKSDDVAGKQPAGNMCVDGGPDQIESKVDVATVVRKCALPPGLDCPACLRLPLTRHSWCFTLSWCIMLRKRSLWLQFECVSRCVLIFGLLFGRTALLYWATRSSLGRLFSLCRMLIRSVSANAMYHFVFFFGQRS